jgi:hypothetical protein
MRAVRREWAGQIVICSEIDLDLVASWGAFEVSFGEKLQRNSESSRENLRILELLE